MLILAVDLVLIVGFILVYNFFLRPDASQSEFNGHSYSIQALEFDGEILISLNITALQNFPAGSTGLLEIEYSLNANFSDSQTTVELLPDRREQTYTSYFRLPIADSTRSDSPRDNSPSDTPATSPTEQVYLRARSSSPSNAEAPASPASPLPAPDASPSAPSATTSDWDIELSAPIESE